MTKKKLQQDGDYEVGYGKPPVHSQFKKGQSGNPSGKPKSQKSLTRLLQEECEKLVNITENGVSQSVQKKQLMIKSLVVKACKGDLVAMKFVIKCLEPQNDDDAMARNFSWGDEEYKLLEQIRMAVEGNIGDEEG